MGRVAAVEADGVLVDTSGAHRLAPLKPGDGIVFDAADWRSPEEAEIAAELGISVDECRARLNDIAALDIGELEFQRDDRELPVLLKYVATPDEDSPAMQLERSELEKLIATCLDGIPKVEKTVLGLYFHEELTLKEIGEIMGMHYSRVSQIKSQAILRLRTSIGRRWPGVKV